MSATDEAISRLRALRLTVAVVEASSGGLIAAELSREPGSSSFFRGGLVAYDHRSKTSLLGIPAALLEREGSVSAAACQAMAQAARDLFQADLGLAETGIAGPGGGTPAKPVGLGYVALATRSGCEVREHRLAGNREGNRQAAAEAALRLLACHVSGAKGAD